MNQPLVRSPDDLDVPDRGSPARPGRRGLILRSAIGGILAALAGLAAGSVAAALLGTRQTPVVAIGSAFIDRVPPWLKDLAISLFGTNDKLALKTGILIVLLAFAALGGYLAVLRYWAGAAVVIVLAGIAVIAAATRPDAGQTGFVPSLIAGAVALLILRLFATRLAGLLATPDDGVSRRGFLQLGAGVALGTVAVGALGRVVGGRRAAVTDAREALQLPLPPSLDPPAGVQAAGATPWATPNEDFYRIDTALSVPLITPADWKLRIHGMVDREINLNFEDLLKRKVVHKWVTLACVSNEVGGDLIGNALWSGVLLKDLLTEAGPAKDADAIQSTSKDGFTAGTPLSTLLDDRRVDARVRDERGAAAGGTRVPGAHRRTGSVRVCVGDQVAGRDRGDPVRPVRGVLDASRMVRARADQAVVADRRTAVEGVGRPGHGRRGRVGPARGRVQGRGPRRWGPLATS